MTLKYGGEQAGRKGGKKTWGEGVQNPKQEWSDPEIRHIRAHFFLSYFS